MNQNTNIQKTQKSTKTEREKEIIHERKYLFLTCAENSQGLVGIP